MSSVFLFLLLWIFSFLTPAVSHALTVCPGERVYLKPGEELSVALGRRPGCMTKYMSLERGDIDRRLYYPSNRFIALNAGQADPPDAWTETPQRIFIKALGQTVVRFLAEAPMAKPAAVPQPPTIQEVCPGRVINLQPGNEVTFRLGKRPGCNVAWSNYDGTVEEFATYPSANSTRRVSGPGTGDFRYPEPPTSIRVKAITNATLRFLAQKPAPAPKPPPVRQQLQQPLPLQPEPQPSPSRPFIDKEKLAEFAKTLFLTIMAAGLVLLLIWLSKKSTTFVRSHWCTLIENLQASSKEFYTSVEAAIKARQVPATNQSRVDWKEGGLYSAYREYLRVSREKHVMDICAAPYGTGFFVSEWLGELRPSPIGPSLLTIVIVALIYFVLTSLFGVMGFLLSIVGVVLVFLFVGTLISQSSGQDWVRYALVIPVVGWLFDRLFLPPTYYRIDSALMFEEAVHQSVLDIIDGMTKAKGLRMLSESERKPIFRDFFQK